MEHDDERIQDEHAARTAAPSRELKRHLDERLDEALEETFPASDPIALTPPRRREARRVPPAA